MSHALIKYGVASLLLIPTGSTWAVDPATIARQGTEQVTACATCHGKDGSGQASFPRLAGLDSAYLQKQLQDFADGRRTSGVMQPIAKAMSAADRAAISSYYAAFPVASWLPATTRASVNSSLGAQLASRGDWSNGVPACVQCHGPGGMGVGANFPAIAGQPAAYIAAQLQAWKDGSRSNDPLGLMGQVSRRLSEEQIRAVSEWFASQPADPGVRTATQPAAGAALAAVAAGNGPAPVGNANKGRQLGYTCSGCHGIAGYSNAYPNYKVPRIGGQSMQYLVNALNGYRSGSRKHPTMQAQARSLSDQDIADIAAFLTAVK